MVEPRSEPGKVYSDTGQYSLPVSASGRADNPDEILILTSLKNLVSAGEHRLDPMLAAIADAARRLSDASGAAIAMWKDGAMVCRARSGTTAPALGAQLNAESGISGECLRTGKVQHCRDTENDPLVDVDVCRRLGLRSIAVLPVQGWRGVNGILEVFSTEPGTFTERHLVLLDQLAALAERARATQPQGASATVATTPAEKAPQMGLLPASDSVGDMARAFLGRHSRPLVWGGIGLAAVLLIGLVIWLGWRSADDDGKAHAAASAPATVGSQPASGRLPDNDPVWKPNPGGEMITVYGGKTSAGTVKLAAKVDVIPGKTASGEKALSGEKSLLGKEAVQIALPKAPEQQPAASTESSTKPAPRVEDTAVEPPAISSDAQYSSALNGVLMAKATLPSLARPISQGVTGGELVHRVNPIYPQQARTLRLAGRVVLSAMVMENGHVAEVKVVQGEPSLAKSAADAVKQWRYSPFLLNGKPVPRETNVTIDFKLP